MSIFFLLFIILGRRIYVKSSLFTMTGQDWLASTFRASPIGVANAYVAWNPT